MSHGWQKYFSLGQAKYNVYVGCNTADYLHKAPNCSMLCAQLVKEINCVCSTACKLCCHADTTKANGHDDISALMLKRTAPSIAPIVTELFNISISHGVLR